MSSRPVAFLVRLTEDEHALLRAKADEEDLTMAQVVRAALRAWLAEK